MRFIFAILTGLFFCLPAWGHDCESHLAGVLVRGPLQLDVKRSELKWSGAEEPLLLRLAPRELEALHAAFWASAGLPENQAVDRLQISAAHAELYPGSTLKPANLFWQISQINRDITDIDPELTYRILSGQYNDILTFSWKDRSIQVREDEYTVLSLLQSQPNRAVSYPEILAALGRSLPQWELISNPKTRVQNFLRDLRKNNPDLPLERLRSAYRWMESESTVKLKFRGFTLDTQLCRLSWQEGNETFELRMKPIECAVVKERFDRGEGKVSWSQVFASPNEERLKTASLIALRVHFSNVRGRVRNLSPEAADRFTTSW